MFIEFAKFFVTAGVAIMIQRWNPKLFSFPKPSELSQVDMLMALAYLIVILINIDSVYQLSKLILAYK